MQLYLRKGKGVNMTKYLIIGNSAAAAGAVEGIRSTDKNGDITIISDEKYHTYSRPLISYLLQGKTDMQRMKYRPDNFYKENKCNFVPEEKAIKIDTVKKIVYTQKTEYKYDKLLVSTGSSPFVPPIKGLETVKQKFAFMCLDDAFSIEKAVSKNSKVFILGAGLIGLKCAEALSNRAAEITVADIADRVLPSILDEDGAEIVKNHLEQNNIKLLLNGAVTEFKENKAVFSDGSTYDFDILVTASGVRPNTSLIKEAGGEVNKGIIIDCTCKTSLDDIYSAGDCTESIDCVTGQRKILALLPNAYMQGYSAGKNMAGENNIFDKALAMNAIGFFGLHILTAGVYEGECYINKSGNNYKKLYYADNNLKGFILIGDTKRAGIYTALIREKKPLSDIDFELIKEKPQLMAFTRNEREEMLGEVRI